MPKRFKPMLAATKPPDISSLAYPVYVTPKIDGVRALVRDGKLLARSLKPHKNKFVVETLMEQIRLPDGLDGELVVKNRTFNELSGDIRRESGEPDFEFLVFDYFMHPQDRYLARCVDAEAIVLDLDNPRVRFLVPEAVDSPEQLQALYESYLQQGYEGAIIRSGDGPYKHGRATLNQAYMLKYKPFEDDEATVIGFVEMMHNENEAKKNALGRTERSTSKEGLRPANMLGKLVLRRSDGVEFGCGSGFSHAQRQEIWANQDRYAGQLAKYKYMAVGAKDRPRLPIFLGWRDPDDLGGE